MKLTKKEEKERMVFVLNCIDKYEEGYYQKLKYHNGFPNVILINKMTPLYLFSSLVNEKGDLLRNTIWINQFRVNKRRN